MTYREHAPPPQLTPWVQCLWERHSTGAPTRVLPDGCIDLVCSEDLGTLIVGANTTAFVVCNPPGVQVAGARLRPGGAPALLGLVAPALTDGRGPVAELWPERGPRLAAALQQHPDPIAAIASALLSCRQTAVAPDPVIDEAVRRLTAGDSITQIAARVGFSERQLRRRVANAVGYGPKRLGRILRLRRALRSAREGGDLARVAHDAGYADQAHFAHDCRELAGLAPSTLIVA